MPPTTKFCPLMSEPCIESGCKFWIHLLGTNPQTGNPTDEWDCSFAWLPILLIENSKETRQAAAATESFRNEVVKAETERQHALANFSQKNLEALPWNGSNSGSLGPR